MTKYIVDEFDQFSNYSTENRSSLSDLFNNGGVLSADKVKKICDENSIDTESLMLSLLPLAEKFAIAPISSFLVGAVVQGEVDEKIGSSNLYLGANFEYKNLSLNFSIHAEQAAVSNAWLNGETGVISIATSAAPCGHCRQFLYELSGANQLPVIMPDEQLDKIKKIDIQMLLPSAFGPEQLGCNQLLMQEKLDKEKLTIKSGTKGKLISDVLEQALLSYAPYTQNYAACGIELVDGTVYFGRYAENVAHNPSLSAFSSAVSQLVLSQAEGKLLNSISRVVFVERPTLSTQKDYAELLFNGLKNDFNFIDTDFEYYQIS